MLVIQAPLNLLGTLAVTVYSVGNKIDVILEQGQLAIGSAMTAYSAQNFGAGKIKRIKKVGAANQIMLVYLGKCWQYHKRFGFVLKNHLFNREFVRNLLCLQNLREINVKC